MIYVFTVLFIDLFLYPFMCLFVFISSQPTTLLKVKALFGGFKLLVAALRIVY